MVFIDSLTGWIVTGNDTPNDSSGYILKTTNAGDNWDLQLFDVRDFARVIFLNNNTGYVCGGYNTGARLLKTTNGGTNWFQINGPGGQIFYNDMSVFNEDTIYITIHESLTGGVFLTTNGGASWTRKYYAGGTSNPDKIYFANNKLGFAERSTHNYLRTTNFGDSWNIVNGPFIWFNDMKFVDSLTGYKANGFMMKTTDGGLNWTQQTLPHAKNFFNPDAIKFTQIGDTLWAVGANIFVPVNGSDDILNFETRGIIYFTSNGGANWGYQLPDTSINIFKYDFVDFINSNTGWAYQSINGGIHTTTGGGPTIYVNVFSISHEIPADYKLHQNYPNPFNPVTRISYDIKKSSDVALDVYDITGKHIHNIVKQRQEPGSYAVDFDARFHGASSGLSSGIYFCILKAGNNFISNIKMLLVK